MVWEVRMQMQTTQKSLAIKGNREMGQQLEGNMEIGLNEKNLVLEMGIMASLYANENAPLGRKK